MKKICTMLTAIFLLSVCIISAAENEVNVPDHLTVGNPTPMQGDFFTNWWGNATSDIDVRDLIHGYNLVRWNGKTGMFTVDSAVISGIVVTENQVGDRSFNLVLYNDLFYSDGSPITAWDYAFSMLLQVSPEIRELGAVPALGEQLLGYSEYINGEQTCLSGVHVSSDYTMTITVNHDYLPFFYELGLLSCNPYPISVLAPGIEVRDDGNGAYLANKDGNETKPAFTSDLLRRTILDEETGYRSHPSVVSGPYILKAWDGNTAEFSVNPYFKGDETGKMPMIESLTYTAASNETMLQQLADGELDYLNKVTRKDNITEGLSMSASGMIKMSNYPRTGLAFLNINSRKEALRSRAVRQAIAWCMDRDSIVQEYTGDFGQRVDGFYGLGQWMFEMINGTVDPPVEAPENEDDAEAQAAYEETLAAYEAVNLDNLTAYTLDTGRAADLLDQDGWTLNADGIREKEGIKLELTLSYPAGNKIGESFERHMKPYLDAVGIRLNLVEMPMAELLHSIYERDAGGADLSFLASNFDLMFDPSKYFDTEMCDPEDDNSLIDIARMMLETEPGDVLSYIQRWVLLQERFNEELPVIPLYGNIYFDFYTGSLWNYTIAESNTWSEAIIGAYLSDVPPETETANEDGGKSQD